MCACASRSSATASWDSTGAVPYNVEMPNMHMHMHPCLYPSYAAPLEKSLGVQTLAVANARALAALAAAALAAVARAAAARAAAARAAAVFAALAPALAPVLALAGAHAAARAAKDYGKLRGQSIIFDYPMHPDWKGGTRITNATNNALTIYDKFTTTEDHVGLIWFNEKSHEEMPLQPREESVESTKRAKGKQPRTESGQRSVLDSTRLAVKGGTAFFDALIKAVGKKPCSYNSYLVALTDGADSDSKATCEEAEMAIAKSPWTVFIIGLEVDPETRVKCERLARASAAGIYMHAADAGAGLDEAFAAVASQFVMPTVKSADAASSGGAARGV